MIELLALVLLLAASASFAASEAAITALSALRMKRLSVVRPALRPYFQEWLSTPHRLLSFLMVGNNLVNFGFSSLAAVVAVPWRNRWSPVVVDIGVWIVVLFFLLVVGEILPKILGRVYRERVAELTLPVMTKATRALFVIWGPVGWALKKWAPEWNQSPTNPLTVTSLEELQHAVSESSASGQMTGESGELFQRALAFAQRTVGDVMQPLEKIDTVALEILDRPNGEDLFLDLLVEQGHSRVPVTRGGQVVGYVYANDLLRSVQRGAVGHEVALIRPLRRVTPEHKAAELLTTFRATGESMAWVESAGKPLGLVTLEDLLEEIVGEILDEYDLEERGGTP